MGQESCETLSGLRVLVAEDEFLNQLLFEDMVEALDAKVVASVSTADQVLAAAEQERPDVVILDVNLRSKRVYDAANALWQRRIPFIFVSGYAMLSDGPPGLRDVPRVKKPFKLKELEAALRQALTRRRTD